MICKYIINALQGQNHQRGATPCEWRSELFQALQGRHKAMCQITPLQGLHLRMLPFHRALPDADAKKAFSLDYGYKLFISNALVYGTQSNH